jgi:hypothetical protein
MMSRKMLRLYGVGGKIQMVVFGVKGKGGMTDHPRPVLRIMALYRSVALQEAFGRLMITLHSEPVTTPSEAGWVVS